MRKRTQGWRSCCVHWLIPLSVIGVALHMSATGVHAQMCQASDTVSKLVSLEAAGDDELGHAAAVDGDVAIVGSPGYDQDDGGEIKYNSGAAYIFRFDGLSWTEACILLPPDPDYGNNFGYSVAIHGGLAIVGAYARDGIEAGAGAAYVYRLDDGGTPGDPGDDAWQYEAMLTADDGVANDWLGMSVAVNGDFAVIGAPYHDESGPSAGAAYVFRYTGTNWVQHAKLLPPEFSNYDEFGRAVAMTQDIALVGSWRDCGMGGCPGSVYVFRRNDGGTPSDPSDDVWEEETKLMPDDGVTSDGFGLRVSISGDVALAGAPYHDSVADSSGAAYIFRYYDSAWHQEAKLVASDAQEKDEFGDAVSIDGGLAAVGAPFFWQDPDPGAAYVFGHDDGGTPGDFTDDIWIEEALVIAGDAEPNDQFGYAVAIGGGHLLVGATNDDDACPSDPSCDSGAVYAYGGMSDCNTNGQLDLCDIAEAGSLDANGNGIPDECEGCDDDEDCDDDQFCNGEETCVDTVCQSPGTPCADGQSCDEAADACYWDCNENGIDDACDIDCGTPGGPCDVAGCGESQDCNGNGVPDECEFDGTIVYVAAGATGGETGASWEDAFTDLQEAIAFAVCANSAVPETITTLWVAAGTYMPAPPGGDRGISFELVNGLRLLGGFPAGGGDLTERDPELHPTILSGDLAGNDGPGFANYDENSYHVVIGSGTDWTAGLEGFTVSGGNANGASYPSDTGGGLYVLDGEPALNACVFTANRAEAGGGAAVSITQPLTIFGPFFVECEFNGNEATTEGGGLWYSKGMAVLVESTFVGNTAAGDGGGLHYTDAGFLGGATMDGCSFSGNSSTNGSGGGVYCGHPSFVDVVNCTLNDNSAHTDGGGVYVTSGGTVELNSCTLDGNTADGDGAGLFLDAMSFSSVYNAVFIGNAATGQGGGIYSRENTDFGSVSLDNCTFYDNAAASGGGLLNDVVSSAMINNCIFWQSDIVDLNPMQDPAAVLVFNSCVQGGWLGDGNNNISDDPLLRDPESDDVHLSDGSPCIDAGDNTGISLTTITDRDGLPRFVNDPQTDDTGNPHEPDAPIVDMGAYEFIPDCNDNDIPDVCEVSCDYGESEDFPGTEPCEIADCGTAEDLDGNGIPDDCACDEDGDCDDGLFCTGVETCIESVCQPGPGDPCLPGEYCNEAENRCDPTFDCNGNGTPDHEEFTEHVVYVDANATGTNSGVSWADAFTQVRDALDFAACANLYIEGMITSVYVAQGTYTPVGAGGDRTVAFELMQGVRLYGGFATGGCLFIERDSALHPTVLSGDLNGDDQPGFVNNDENSYHVVLAVDVDYTAVLDGFTVQGGNANGAGEGESNGGGLHMTGGGPTIIDCTFTENTAVADGGGLALVSPLIPVEFENCQFTGNVAGTNGGALYVSDGNVALLKSVLAGNAAETGAGGGVYVTGGGYTLFDCLVVGNSADEGGGLNGENEGVGWCLQCVFSGNTATLGGGIHAGAGGSVLLDNCTFGENSATLSGGAMFNELTSLVSMTNCIVWGSTIGGDDPFSVNATYSCIQGGWGQPEDHNIDGDPLFKDADGDDDILGTADDDLDLFAGSPCIDAGDTSQTASLSVTDHMGKPRIVNDPDTDDTGFVEVPGSPMVDIGAFEFVPDCNTNGIYDVCETDCDYGEDESFPGIEPCDVPDCGTGVDTNGNWIPDECESCTEDEDCDDGLFCTGVETCVDDLCQPGSGNPCGTGEVCNEELDKCEPMVDCNNNSVADSEEFADGIVYVDHLAPGADIGAGWADAFVELRDALAFTACANAGLEGLIHSVYVASGTYMPAVAGGDRGVSFSLVDGVSVYGGFPSGGGDFAVRDPATHLTVLSGDLNGDDQPGFINVTDNSYHVVTAIGLDVHTASLDGFRICGGNADDASAPHNAGGGVYITNGGLKIVECVFADSRAEAYGGGGHCEVGSVHMRDCTFEGNQADRGGGMAIVSIPTFTATEFMACTFDANTAATDGGGLYIHDDDIDASLNVIECAFVGNTATGGAGGGLSTSNSDLGLFDCKFVGNTSVDGGGVFCGGEGFVWSAQSIFSGNMAKNGGGLYGGGSAVASLEESSFNANTAALSGGGVYNEKACMLIGSHSAFWQSPIVVEEPLGVQFTYCCIPGGWGEPEDYNIDGDPAYADGDGADDIVGTLDDDLQLAPGSPCIDAGNNQGVAYWGIVDHEGRPRYIDDPDTDDTGFGNAPLIDIGAHEYAPDCDGDGVFDVCELDCQYGAPEPPEIGPCDVDGCGGSVDLDGNGVPDECICTIGDVNSDDVIDGLDIDVFVRVVLEPGTASAEELCACDTDGNQQVDTDDISGFVSLVLSP